MFESAPPVAMFKLALSCDIVDCGWNTTPPIRSVWPLNVFIHSLLGTDHSLHRPDQAPVTTMDESGLNAHCASGRSSASWDDQFV
jgi:hypothetical protein